uniref:Uncharacterized protein n=1 Tax=Labrus bergylta TaxID=56723 RepID=A0A3Q3G8K5_9LABR
SLISSGSLEQSFPAAAFRSCRIRGLRVTDIKTALWLSVSRGVKNSSLLSLTLRSILAKPRALDARSLASWNSSLSDRLVSITDRNIKYLISSEAVLSSAHSQNSLPLFCRPASRNSPVDFSSIPAISLFPDCASPPRM